MSSGSALFWFYGLVGAIVGLAITGWTAAGAEASAGVLAINVGLLYVTGIVLSALEVAVAAGVTRALSDHPVMVQIGTGPTLFSRLIQRGDAALALHAMPIGSRVTIATTRRSGQRMRLTLVVVAIVIFHCVVAALLVANGPSWSALKASLGTEVAPIGLAILVASLYAVVSIWSLLTIAGTDKKALDSSRVLGHMIVASRHIRDGAFAQAEQAARRGLDDVPGSELLEVMLLQAMSVRDDDSILPRATQLLERELAPLVRAAAQNIWAWQVYIEQRDEHREKADELSRSAVETSPHNAGYLDTRGHILLWLGRTAEAEPALLRAHAMTDAASTRASSAAALAILYAGKSDIDEAHRWLATARRGNVHERLVARATALVEPLRRTPS